MTLCFVPQHIPLKQNLIKVQLVKNKTGEIIIYLNDDMFAVQAWDQKPMVSAIFLSNYSVIRR